MKWILMRFLLRTLGRLSEGIRIGYRHGWAREAGFEDVVSRMEKVGLFAVTTAHNTGDGL
ncbi:hypothetical protein E1267_17645 [Nonomuraea longispora]|uniref:Uncharacterized protein n=1 Tax=Nonomuraea longispora TaxID=1848320 RepID=A0A4V2XKD0_9ACTN|nr:hypothetical protein [Nonomuraea longispora]TDC06036.1 hypothetical protein E1267_17645 [Nonomuraea longispora]